MKTCRTKRFLLVSTTDEASASLGMQIRDTFAVSDIPIDSPLAVLKAALELPIGTGFLCALRKEFPQGDKERKGALRIRSPMRRHRQSGYSILIPDIFFGIPKKALKLFRDLSEAELMSEIRNAIGPLVIPACSSFSQFSKWIEASNLGLGYPPALVAYTNFINDFAVPSSGRKKNSHSAKNSRKTLEKFSWVHDQLTNGSLTTDSSILKDECLRLARDCEEEEKALIEAAVWYAFDFTPCRSKYGNFKPRTTPGTDETYLNSLRRAWEVLRDGVLTGDLDGPLEIAVSILRNSGVIESEHSKAGEILNQSRASSIDGFKLLTPSELDAAFHMPARLPGPLEVASVSDRALAELIIKILLRNALIRFDALTSCVLSDFSFRPDLIEWTIRDSKGHPLELPFPLSDLTPNGECDFLRIAFPRLLALGPDRSLLTIAEISSDPLSKSVAQQDWVRRFNEGDGTHISRATALSWLPIRALCRIHPTLLNHAALSKVRDHVWFSPAELEKLEGYFPSEATDVAEVIRLLVGWENKRQFFGRYFRTSYTLLDLYRMLANPLVR